MTDILIDRVPPNSKEAELAVLGAMLIDNNLIASISNILQPDDFYTGSHSVLHRAILSLSDKGSPMDAITLCQHMRTETTLDRVGGAGYVMSILDAVNTTAHVDHYVAMIKNNATRRSIVKACAEAIDLSYSEAPVSDIHELLTKSLMVNTESLALESRTCSSLVAEFIETLRKRKERGYTFFRTGLKCLDKRIGYMIAGELWTVAGRPGSGKTSFMVQSALKMSEFHRVLYLTSEMPESGIIGKCIANYARIDSNLFRRDIQHCDVDEVERKAGKMHNLNLSIKRVSRFRYSQMSGIVASAKPDVVFVDYLGRFILPAKKDNRASAFSDIVNGLKDISMEQNVLMVLGAQIGREAKKRDNGKPRMSDLKESGGIEEASDGILALHTTEESDIINQTDVCLLKNRSGATLTHKVEFLKTLSVFEELETDEEKV